jgi:hypothetical protein
VDAFTGEGYSLISIAKRWPTIISDFIRMKEEWTDVAVIRDKLDVSTAEASILKTKNELFKEWKMLFMPTVKERYARIVTLMNARKKSIDEYKNWLKPYVARYRMIREKQEGKPSEFVSNPYMTPGFGQSQASAGVRLWVWKPYAPSEKGRAPSDMRKKGGLRTKFIVDPYDDLVRKWQENIEKAYSVKFTEKDVRGLIDQAVQAGEMDPRFLYYIFFDVRIQLNLVKTPPPQGSELDNVGFMPLKTWVMSQNILLIVLLELRAREMAFERYIGEVIGAKELEEEEVRKIEEEFKPPAPEKRKRVKGFVKRVKGFRLRGRKAGERFFYIFVKKGPYEVNWEERLTKMYFRTAGGLYNQQVGFLLSKMGVD